MCPHLLLSPSPTRALPQRGNSSLSGPLAVGDQGPAVAAAALHLSRMGLSCSSSGLALPRIRFRASAYSASLCANVFTGRAGRLAELGLLSTPLLVGLFKIRICGGGPEGRLSSWITMGTLGGDLDFLLLKGRERRGK